MLNPSAISEASARLAPYIHRTPLLRSRLLNQWLGHEVVFKVESFQKIGAFKARGALNTLLSLKDAGRLPASVVAYSSGNHAQGVAWAGALLAIPTTIYLPESTSSIKQQSTRSYGANVVLTQTRQEAEALTAQAVEKGSYCIPPFDHNMVIAGQGTACFEALQDMAARPDAIFAPCGGGGLLSGTFLASRLLSPQSRVYAAEPLLANDAAESVRTGSIFRFHDMPPTLADGARTLAVSPRTFHYLQQLAGFYEITEEEIIYWTQWITHLLKISCEPTAAMAMAACFQWLKEQDTPKQALVILSGGNTAPETCRKIWAEDCLKHNPDIFMKYPG